MASLISSRERAWALVVHAPIITIIWVSYIGYLVARSNESLLDVISQHFFSRHSLPIMPLLFTFMTIPISLFIYQAQRRSSFVKAHANQAYLFNVSLMQWYACCLTAVVIGEYLTSSALVKAGFLILSCVSVNCFIQAMLGMRAALMGKPYNYRFVTRHFSR